MSYLNTVYPDFRARTNNVILTQYHNSPNLSLYISAFVDVFEDLEVAVIESVQRRYLEDGGAAQLDDIAEIVGAVRTLPFAKPLGYFGYYENPQASIPSVGDDGNATLGGVLKGDLDPASGDFILTDAELTRFIKAKVIKNSSFLSADDVILYIETAFGRSIDIETIESTTRNAAQIIIHETLGAADKALLAAIIKMMKAASIEYTLTDSSGPINLAGQPSSMAKYSKFLESLS